jgi:hypothetical protein
MVIFRLKNVFEYTAYNYHYIDLSHTYKQLEGTYPDGVAFFAFCKPEPSEERSQIRGRQRNGLIANCH